MSFSHQAYQQEEKRYSQKAKHNRDDGSHQLEGRENVWACDSQIKVVSYSQIALHLFASNSSCILSACFLAGVQQRTTDSVCSPDHWFMNVHRDCCRRVYLLPHSSLALGLGIHVTHQCSVLTYETLKLKE